MRASISFFEIGALPILVFTFNLPWCEQVTLKVQSSSYVGLSDMSDYFPKMMRHNEAISYSNPGLEDRLHSSR